MMMMVETSGFFTEAPDLGGIDGVFGCLASIGKASTGTWEKIAGLGNASLPGNSL